jgi:ribosomal protein L3 glutamine methyltransferase
MTTSMKNPTITLSQLQHETQSLQTLGELLSWAEQLFIEHQLFFGHGTLDAWDEAVWIMAHILKISRHADRSCLTRILSADEKTASLELIFRRITENKPTAYLLKSAPFAGLEFYVDERVLIPRSPIEQLIKNQFQPWIDPTTVKSIVDIGTGSGCIAIACAHYFANARVDACDIATDALAVTQINIERFDLQQRVTPIQSDLYSALNNKRYDIIVSNPPYLDAIDMTDLPAEYLHEPMHALAAGSDGLQFAIPLLQQAHQHLTPHGIIIIEVGNSEAALFARFPTVPFYSLEFEDDGYGVVLLTAEQIHQFHDDLQA